MDTARWERIQEIFHAASEMQPAERPDYLDRACDGEHPLRREVERYLANLDPNRDPISHAVEEAAAGVVARQQGPASGATIAGYRLEQKIGEGGMGSVYLASREEGGFRQQVAIKLIRPEKAGPDLLRRFRTERRILSGLIHPHIARLLEGGIADDGTPYFVMEYVDGLPLDEHCRTHALSMRQRAQLFRSVCAAVEYAHRSLAIHRDIKPSNILVTSGGAPKLLDFGIAKLLQSSEESGAPAADSTRPAERLMTIEYASPEQIRGDPVTTATDVYSLGTVFYELLVGVRPFDLQSRNFLDAQRVVCESEPRRPSAAVQSEAERRTLRGDLDNIVLKAMRKEPESRYSSVEQFSEDVRRYLEGFPVSASKGSTRYRAAKFIERHRTGVAVSAGVALMAAAFLIAMGILAARVRQERDEARVERARAVEVSRFLRGVLASSDPFRGKGASVSAKDVLDSGFARIQRDLQTQPQVRASILETMAQAYQHLGLQREAETAYRLQADAARAGFGPVSQEYARALRELADVERQRSELDEAERDLRHSLTIERAMPNLGDEVAHTLNNLGLVLQSRGRLDEAEPLFRQAIEIARKSPPMATEALTMMSNLGGVLGDRAAYGEAEILLREVLARRRQALPAGHPQIFISMNRLGRVLDREGKWVEAESLYREALDRQRALLGGSHLDVLASTNNLAMLLAARGNLEEAEEMLRGNVTTGLRALGEQADVALWMANLGAIRSDRLDFREAGEWFPRALEITRTKFGARSARAAHILELQGAAQAAAGDFSSSEKSLQQALSIDMERLPANHPETAQVLFDLAELGRAQGKTGSIEFYQRALAMDDAVFPAGHVQSYLHRLAYAGLLATAGNAAAEATARGALDGCRKLLPPDAWQIDEARSALSAVLVSLHKYPEAEPLALGGWAGIRSKAGEHTLAGRMALSRVVALYRSWGKSAEAARYRQALSK